MSPGVSPQTKEAPVWACAASDVTPRISEHQQRCLISSGSSAVTSSLQVCVSELKEFSMIRIILNAFSVVITLIMLSATNVPGMWGVSPQTNEVPVCARTAGDVTSHLSEHISGSAWSTRVAVHWRGLHEQSRMCLQAQRIQHYDNGYWLFCFHSMHVPHNREPVMHLEGIGMHMNLRTGNIHTPQSIHRWGRTIKIGNRTHPLWKAFSTC